MVPVWGINPAQDAILETALRAKNFAPVLLQTGMYLSLSERETPGECSLKIHTVATPAHIQEWTKVASTSFGYAIDAAVIAQLLQRPQPDITLLLAYHINESAHDNTNIAADNANPQAVATALLFTTGNTMGVHMVGVLPSARGQGIALQLMQAIIRSAKQQGCQAITLQASAAGEGIYRRLGFQEQFLLRSFKRI